MKSRLLVMIMCVLLTHCKDAEVQSPKTHTTREVAEGILVEYSEGWNFHYKYDGEPRILIGIGVGFMKRDKNTFIIDIGGSTELNVPCDTDHEVRVVDKEGCVNTPYIYKSFDSDDALFESVRIWRSTKN